MYIGSSTDINKRLYSHFHLLNKGIHPNIHLQRAFNQSGSVFVGGIMVECDSHQLIQCEQYMLDYYRGELYNIRTIADRNTGVKWTEDQRKHMSRIVKGRKYSEEVKQKLREAKKGFKPSKETIKKAHTSLKKLHKDPIFMENFRKKVSDGHKKRWLGIPKKRPDPKPRGVRMKENWTNLDSSSYFKRCSDIRHAKGHTYKVAVYRDGELVDVFNDAKSAGVSVGSDPKLASNNVLRVIKGIRKHYKGYTFSKIVNE